MAYLVCEGVSKSYEQTALLNSLGAVAALIGNEGLLVRKEAFVSSFASRITDLL